jgi:hypothetical protein
MIVSYRHKRTADFAAGTRVKAFSGVERAARLKLDRLEAAHRLTDLAALPGNRFEALKGDRKGHGRRNRRDRRTLKSLTITEDQSWRESLSIRANI